MLSSLAGRLELFRMLEGDYLGGIDHSWRPALYLDGKPCFQPWALHGTFF